MNKAKINELARKADGKKSVSTDDGNDPKAKLAARTDKEVFLQAMIYAALVGGSDFARTHYSEEKLCQIAYARSETAVRVWREQKAKEQA